MTAEKQEIRETTADGFLDEVTRLSREGWRLVQIGCTRLDDFQIDYSFDRDHRLLTLRVSVPAAEPVVPSISGIYRCAFTYENEIHDLFGVRVGGMRPDYGGNFYRIPLKAPFNVPPAREKGET